MVGRLVTAGIKVIQSIIRVGGKTGGRATMRVGNRAAVSHTKLVFKTNRDKALRKIGLNYDQMHPIAQKFVDETHEVIARTVTNFALDVAESEWQGLGEESRLRVYKDHLFRACANAVFSRVKSNAFNIGFDLGAGGDALRMRYANSPDPVLDFMNDYEWLKVMTMSLMDSVLEELDRHQA